MAQERRAAVLLSPDRVYSTARLSPAWRDDDIAFLSDWGFAVNSGSPAPGPRNTRARWPARPDSIG
jgi:hypothetical protein